MQKKTHKREILLENRLRVGGAQPVHRVVFSLFYPNKPHSLVSPLRSPLTVLVSKSLYISQQSVFLETITAVTTSDIVNSPQLHTNSFKGDVLIIMNYTACVRAKTA